MDEHTSQTSLDSPETEAEAPRPRRPAPPSRISLLLSSALATSGWATMAVLSPLTLLTVVLWAVSNRAGSALDVVSLALGTWVSAHATHMTVAGLPLTVPPLLLTVLCVWRIGKAAAATTRTIGPHNSAAVRAGAGAVSLVYFCLYTAAVLTAQFGPFEFHLAHTLIGGAVVIVVSAAIGANTALGHPPWMEVSAWMRRAFRTGALTTLSLLAVSALAVGVSFALRTEETADIVAYYGDQGWITVLLSLLYLPNLMIWALAYLVGAGFSVGTDTAVQIGMVEAGALPAVPLFGAVPVEPLPDWGTAIVAFPLLLSMVWGVMLTYRSPDLRLARVMFAACAAALWATLFLMGLSWLSSGAMGSERLSDMGADPVDVGLIGGTQILLGMVGASMLGRLFAVQRQAVRHDVVRADTVPIPEQTVTVDEELDWDP
ncbi:DUF6350 family protein [Haloglycomyces albus]|uniref:cell division protein PerM n=1 Tax=Haloglycomyces albus TaxID=526067 RepID=UPI0012EB5BC9|nr:DUF6350 family protein [Haloglycomyces albus]